MAQLYGSLHPSGKEGRKEREGSKEGSKGREGRREAEGRETGAEPTKLHTVIFSQTELYV